MAELFWGGRLSMFSWAGSTLAHYTVLLKSGGKMVQADSEVTKKFVKRAADDQPAASPAYTSLGERFYQKLYRHMQRPEFQTSDGWKDCSKAFTNSQCRKVLGFWFWSTDLTWTILMKKRNCRQTDRAGHQGSVSSGNCRAPLHDGPYLKILRFNLNREVAARLERPEYVWTIENSETGPTGQCRIPVRQ
jgi:hypothetical protein